MKIDDLRRRIEAIEAKAQREAITLADGTAWTPKRSMLHIFVDLMDHECAAMCGERPVVAPETKEEARMWAKYQSRAGDPPFFGMIAQMSKNLIAEDQ